MKLWREIDYKRCVHKTSQALREKDKSDDYSVPATKEAVAAGENALGEIDSKLKELAEQTSLKSSNKRKQDDVDLSDLANATLRRAGFSAHSQPQATNQERVSSNSISHENTQTKKSVEFTRPSWWGQGIPTLPSSYRQYMEEHGTESATASKRRRTDDVTPLPPDAWPNRQMSMFNFLSGTGIFGRNSSIQAPMGVHQEQQPLQASSGVFPFSGGNRNSWFNTTQQDYAQFRNQSLLISNEASNFRGGMNQQQPLGSRTINQMTNDAMSSSCLTNASSFGGHANPPMMMNQWGGQHQVTAVGANDMVRQGSRTKADTAPPPMNRLTSQVSDWLTSFLPGAARQDVEATHEDNIAPPPVGNELERSISSSIFGDVQSATLPTQNAPPPADNLERSISSSIFGVARSAARQTKVDPPPPAVNLERSLSSSIFGLLRSVARQSNGAPPPPGPDLERSISSSIFGAVRSPSQFLTNLRSGVTSMFSGTADLEPNAIAEPIAARMPPFPSASASAPRDSLLDDYEESPMEAQLRLLSPR